MAAPAAANERITRSLTDRDEVKTPLEVIATDAASAGLVLGGDRAHEPAVTDVGFGIGVTAAPLVHLANGPCGLASSPNLIGAAESLALRVTLPLATAWLAEQMTPSICDEESVVGFTVGLMAVSVIDASTIAKKPAKHSRIRDLRPDLTFLQGGVKVAIATKW